MYSYKLALDRVVDGDTVDGYIDLGFGIKVHKRIRLYGINAPETRTKDEDEKKRGLRTRTWLQHVLHDEEITVKTEKDSTGKYGRVLGTLFIRDININEKMLDLGLVTKYLP